jgi:hypothetical protein
MGNSKSQVAQDVDLEINLANFKLQRVVGKGSYGKVWARLGESVNCRSVSWNLKTAILKLKNNSL